MREWVRISKAVSDETRIRMLKLLLRNDICVCEMHEIFSLSHPQVSRNLKTLMDAGFLKRWREGKCIVYGVERNNSNRYCRAILDALDNSFDDEPVVHKDKEKLKVVIASKMREQM